MKTGGIVSVALIVVALPAADAQLPEDLRKQFEDAERRIVRLSPAVFEELPGNLVRDLERRGCMIPQEAFTKGRHNVIRGSFAKAGQTDWAVLCSIKGVSSILVFWNGSEKDPAEIAKLEDRIFLQGITADRIGYSRGIRPVGSDFILGHYRAYGGPKPPPMDHQGIDDAFVEKGSTTWYFYGGQWLRLSGSD